MTFYGVMGDLKFKTANIANYVRIVGQELDVIGGPEIA